MLHFNFIVYALLSYIACQQSCPDRFYHAVVGFREQLEHSTENHYTAWYGPQLGLLDPGNIKLGIKAPQ